VYTVEALKVDAFSTVSGPDQAGGGPEWSLTGGEWKKFSGLSLCLSQSLVQAEAPVLLFL